MGAQRSALLLCPQESDHSLVVMSWPQESNDPVGFEECQEFLSHAVVLDQTGPAVDIDHQEPSGVQQKQQTADGGDGKEQIVIEGGTEQMMKYDSLEQQTEDDPLQPCNVGDGERKQQ